jgi:hypothetical protein
MKQLFLFIICLLPLMACAQKDTNPAGGDSVRSINIYEDGCWRDWHKIDSAWMYGQYHKILQRYDLHMNCANCEDVLMEVEMTINSDGRLKDHRIIRSDKCGADFDKALENAFMDWFYDLQFPDVFRNSRFKVQLGTGLKC